MCGIVLSSWPVALKCMVWLAIFTGTEVLNWTKNKLKFFWGFHFHSQSVWKLNFWLKCIISMDLLLKSCSGAQEGQYPLIFPVQSHSKPLTFVQLDFSADRTYCRTSVSRLASAVEAKGTLFNGFPLGPGRLVCNIHTCFITHAYSISGLEHISVPWIFPNCSKLTHKKKNEFACLCCCFSSSRQGFLYDQIPIDVCVVRGRCQSQLALLAWLLTSGWMAGIAIRMSFVPTFCLLWWQSLFSL